MLRRKVTITNEELLELANKPWATSDDIVKIAGVAPYDVPNIKRKIANKLKERGYSLPRSKIPMKELLREYNIDITYYARINEVCNTKKGRKNE